jgi:hypothetical protein
MLFGAGAGFAGTMRELSFGEALGFSGEGSRSPIEQRMERSPIATCKRSSERTFVTIPVFLRGRTYTESPSLWRVTLRSFHSDYVVVLLAAAEHDEALLEQLRVSNLKRVV